MGEWDFVEQIFLTDENYVERNMEALEKEKQEVEKLSIKLTKKLENKMLDKNVDLWKYLTETVEYKRLQELHTQINGYATIVSGDYYFENVFLPKKKQSTDQLHKGKYYVKALLKSKEMNISLRDLDKEIIKEKNRTSEAGDAEHDNRVSQLRVAIKFIENEIDVVYDQKMDKKEKFEYLKLLKLLNRHSSKLQYLYIPSVNRIENDLLSVPPAYHTILYPIKREIMKEITIDKLDKLGALFLLFDFSRERLERYVIYELSCILDLALTTNLEYALDVLSQKSDRLIKKLNDYNLVQSIKSKNKEEKQSIFEKLYMKILLWLIENKFHLTDKSDLSKLKRGKVKSEKSRPVKLKLGKLKYGKLKRGIKPRDKQITGKSNRDKAGLSPDYMGKIACLKQKTGNKIYLENISMFMKDYNKEIAQLVLENDEKTQNKSKWIVRPDNIEKYRVLLQMILDMRKVKSMNNPFLIEEIIAVIQVVRKCVVDNVKIGDPSYKGGKKPKAKSLNSILNAMVKRYNAQQKILKMDSYRYQRILFDMIEEQKLKNYGPFSLVEQKKLIRKVVYQSFLNELDYRLVSLSFDDQEKFISGKEEALKIKIFLRIYG